MAYRRRRTNTRRPARRYRRTVRRTRRVPRNLDSKGQKVVHLKRMASQSALNGLWNIGGNAAYAPYTQTARFFFQDVAGFTEVTGMFDQVRINMIVCKFYLKTDPTAQTALAATFPRLYWRHDYDDTNLPANLDELRESAEMKHAILRPDRPVTIKVKPAVLTNLFQSGISNAYSPKWKTWFDLAYNPPLYGLKWAIDDFTNTNYRLNCELIYYFSVRGTR